MDSRFKSTEKQSYLIFVWAGFYEETGTQIQSKLYIPSIAHIFDNFFSILCCSLLFYQDKKQTITLKLFMKRINYTTMS